MASIESTGLPLSALTAEQLTMLNRLIGLGVFDFLDTECPCDF